MGKKKNLAAKEEQEKVGELLNPVLFNIQWGVREQHVRDKWISAPTILEFVVFLTILFKISFQLELWRRQIFHSGVRTPVFHSWP